MKKLLATAFMMMSFAAFARSDTGVVFVRAEGQTALHAKIKTTVAQINNGRYRSFNDSCGGARRKVYAVETNGLRYRFDRYGNMSAYYSAAIKYSC